MSNIDGKLPDILSDAVLKQSVPVPDDYVKVEGIDYSKPESRNMKAKDLIASMATMGFQASFIARKGMLDY